MTSRPRDVACGANTYSLSQATTCTSCSTGSASSAGASYCTCQSGYYSATGFSTSTPCTRTLAQRWRVLPGSPDADAAGITPLRWPPRSIPLVCPLNAYCSGTGNTQYTLCNAGYATKNPGQASASACYGTVLIPCAPVPPRSRSRCIQTARRRTARVRPCLNGGPWQLARSARTAPTAVTRARVRAWRGRGGVSDCLFGVGRTGVHRLRRRLAWHIYTRARVANYVPSLPRKHVQRRDRPVGLHQLPCGHGGGGARQQLVVCVPGCVVRRLRLGWLGMHRPGIPQARISLGLTVPRLAFMRVDGLVRWPRGASVISSSVHPGLCGRWRWRRLHW